MSYDGKRDINPRRYLDRVDSSGACSCETSTSALDIDTLSCIGSSSSEEEKEEVSDLSSTSSSSEEEYPKVSFMIRLFSVKVINVTFSLSRTIDDVRTEIQAQFGLVPSQYILKAGCKTLSNSNCSLLDYNITSNQTLDIVLRANQCHITSNQTLDIVLRANQCLRGGTGAEDNNSQLSMTPTKETCDKCGSILSSNYDGSPLKQLFMVCCGALICYRCLEDDTVGAPFKEECSLCKKAISKSNEERVNRCLDKAIGHNHKAVCVLADCFLRGEWGVPQDISKAIQLWEVAFELGSPAASYNLGVAYLKGDGVEKDVSRAFEYFAFAAQGGHDVATKLIHAVGSN